MSKKSRKQKEYQEAAENAGVVYQQEELNKEDYANIADKCYHNKEAIQLSTYNAYLSKYGVLYRGKWYIVLYNRDAKSASCSMDYDTLTDAEDIRFNQFKNRVAMNKLNARLQQGQ